MMNQFVQIYKRINKPVLQQNILSDILLVIPRVICGYLLARHFGGDKFGMPWSPSDRNLDLFEVIYWFPQDVAEYGGVFGMFPIFFAWMGAFSEAVGGVLLVIGLKTRVASFLIICTMLVAIFLQKWNQGMWNMLPAAGFLWVGLYSLVLGSGRFGVDYLIDRRLSK